MQQQNALSRLCRTKRRWAALHIMKHTTINLNSSWDKIVDVTVFLTNMKKDFPVYNKIYGEYFTNVQACRTTVEVKSLPTPIAIELKVVAIV